MQQNNSSQITGKSLQVLSQKLTVLNILVARRRIESFWTGSFSSEVPISPIAFTVSESRQELCRTQLYGVQVVSRQVKPQER